MSSQTPHAYAKITLTGVQETLLMTLAARAQDAASPSPLLHDTWATRTLARINPDYDWRRTWGSQGFQAFLIMRGRFLDAWTAEFLQVHAATDTGATVLHLACGLDSRCLRLAPLWTATGNKVTWVDVDLPDVVALRKEVGLDSELPAEGDYELRAADVLAEGWLDSVRADRPTIVVMEGLVAYLEPQAGVGLFRALTRRFREHGGVAVCEMPVSLTIRHQANTPIPGMGARMCWAVDDVEGVVRAVREGDDCGAFALDKVLMTDEIPGFVETFPWHIRLVLGLLRWMPFQPRTIFWFARFKF